MTWTALRYEIALELHEHTATMWDAWDMHTPTRTEYDRRKAARDETKRRIAVLEACGRIREVRRLESYQRAWERRKSKHA